MKTQATGFLIINTIKENMESSYTYSQNQITDTSYRVPSIPWSIVFGKHNIQNNPRLFYNACFCIKSDLQYYKLIPT
jgi:hypothetical protein